MHNTNSVIEWYIVVNPNNIDRFPRRHICIETACEEAKEIARKTGSTNVYVFKAVAEIRTTIDVIISDEFKQGE